jgi:hypothetical protein
MIQILLHNLKMDPLVSLHYYAPVCAAINLVVLPFTEGLAPFYELQNLGVGVLVTNASVAFLLNVAAVFLVGVGSGLVLTLAGVFKVSNWFLWSFILESLWRFSVSWCALHIRYFLSYPTSSFHFIYDDLISFLSRAFQPRHSAHICTLQLALLAFCSPFWKGTKLDCSLSFVRCPPSFVYWFTFTRSRFGPAFALLKALFPVLASFFSAFLFSLSSITGFRFLVGRRQCRARMA